MNFSKSKKSYFLLFFCISIFLHITVLAINSKHFKGFELLNAQNKPKKFKIHSIKQVGEEKGSENTLAIKPKLHQKIAKRIEVSELAPHFSQYQETETEKNAEKSPPKQVREKKAIKALSLNKKSIKNFLKSTPNEQSSTQFLDALGDTDSIVKLEVPKGVKESELNKHELVFYSFQKRTAITYINSFYKKLNQFKLENPHLQFPMTKDPQKMVGRVIYDKDGNIVKINMMKWTKVKKLQDFFLEVLEEMIALPNPPKEILKDEQFTVFFALTVNG